MPLPRDEHIQAELMRLLLRQPGQKMESADVYLKLAESFPALTVDERTLPYRNSTSHWANRVQFAVLHLRKIGWLSSTHVGERGIWEVTSLGKQGVKNGDDLLRELDEL
jgi:restriction endonuclease Mrr